MNQHTDRLSRQRSRFPRWGYWYRAIALDSEYAAAYYNRGSLYDDLGEYRNAIADYSQAIALDPNYTQAFDILTALHYAQGQ